MKWPDIWRAKAANAPDNPTKSDLMALCGYDTGAGAASFDAMQDFSRTCIHRLGLGAGISVLDVGCGAGVWLLGPARAGAVIFGADFSEGHLGVARKQISLGKFTAATAERLPFRDKSFDAVVHGSCFLYLDTWESAHRAFYEAVRVLKPGGRGLISDLPDMAMKAESEAVRRGALGEAEYRRLYSGLEHQYFDKGRMLATAGELGVRAEILPQEIAGYGNTPYRFNLWFEKP